MANTNPEGAARGSLDEDHYRECVNADEKCLVWLGFQAMTMMAHGRMDAVAYSFHPHIKLRDLSDFLKTKLGDHVRAMMEMCDQRKSNATFSEVYLASLEDFGVDCPHVPKMESRYYDDLRCDLECAHCGTVVFYDRPEDCPRAQMIAWSLRFIGQPPVVVDWTGTASPLPYPSQDRPPKASP